MLNAAIKRNQANVGSISIIWIGFVYFGLLLFGNVSSRAGAKTRPAGILHSVLSGCLKGRTGGEYGSLWDITFFFSLPFRWQRISNLDVFTFVLRWILERRANRSVRRTQSLLLERDGSYLQRFAHFTLILFVLFDHFHYRAQVLQKSNSQEDPPSTQLVPTTSNNKRELYGLFDWHVVESNRFWKDTSGHWLQCCSYNYPHFSLNVR